MSKLLPQNNSEFHNKSYWDNFFIELNNQSFEWYGNFVELESLLLRSIKLDFKILITGCGNSNFSFELYDRGYHNVTNIDFSELVINEMISKNGSRSKMKWDIGDITCMSMYSNQSFDIVFDKGALDALMSIDTEEIRLKATSMFQEIERILKIGGKYICITLAENFIINTLLDFFSNDNQSEKLWHVQVHGVQSQRESPFLPFFIEITKLPVDSKVSPGKNIRLFVNHLGEPMKSPTERAVAATNVLNSSDVIERILAIQQFHQKQYQLRTFQEGRFETLQFWSVEHQSIPRFTVFVLDDDNPVRTLSCAVFMVPFGREADYQFTTREGLSTIADQANCKRLIAVCCNRPHSFPDMKQLQAELSPIAMSVSLRDMDKNESIPFMAINTESDWTEIGSGESAYSGNYIIEESEDDEKPSAVLRRLIFLHNQNFIQTEVRMLSSADRAIAKKANKKSKKKNNKSIKESTGNATQEDSEYAFDYDYLDSHHCAALASLLLSHSLVSDSIISKVSNCNAEVKKKRSALLIGLGGGALYMTLRKYLPALQLWSCEIDPSVIQVAYEYFGLEKSSNEKIFSHEGMSLLNNLLEMVTSDKQSNSRNVAALGSAISKDQAGIDALFIDCDGKDASLGLTAPPASFTSIEALLTMYSLLSSGGLLYFNVVARSQPMLNDFLFRIAAVFDIDLDNFASNNNIVRNPTEIFEEMRQIESFRSSKGLPAAARGSRLYRIKPSSETINEGIVVVKGDNTASSSATVGNKSSEFSRAEISAREDTLDMWLKSVGKVKDPLQLGILLGKLMQIN